ncbi:MAG TPA: MFS transporter, partial [Acinetobacter junii]|nr:MFS transporter [Acinetobacter junii]
VPSEQLLKAKDIQVTSQYQQEADSKFQLTVPYLIASQKPQIQLLPMSGNDQLSSNDLKQSLVIKGQLAGVNVDTLDTERPVVIMVDDKEIVAKVDPHGIFTGAVDGKVLLSSPTKLVKASVNFKNNNQTELATSRPYFIDTATHPQSALDMDVQPVQVIQPDQKRSVELSGKVIKSYSTLWLYLAIIMDNLASGLAGAAFIAFLSSLTSVSFTAVQYAIFSSLMTLTPKLLGGYSGTIVSNIGYPNFFLMTTLIGIPILILVVWVAKLLRDHERNQTTQQTGE